MQKNRILIIRLSSLGDIMHTYPMVYDIKSRIANCTIDWLVDESFTELVKLNPLVDNVLSIPLRQWKKNKLKLLTNINTWRKNIDKIPYQYIIDAQGLLKSALLARCFNGPVYGLGKNSIREKIATLFYDIKYETGKNILAITKNRLLAAAIFNYAIDLTVATFGLSNISFAPNVFNLTKPYIIFFHATSKDSKKLSISAWAKLGQYLVKNHDVAIIIPFGDAAEKNEAITIKSQINSADVIIPDKRLEYSELYALINNASFVFGVDTGLIHLANALDKRLIAIYVDTNPHKTGIFESTIAKNIGNKNLPPDVLQLINLYENILKV